MNYTFSLGWFFVGLLVVAAGVAFTRWYKVIADNLGNGVASYDRYRLWALITCGVGLLVMLNLHTFILRNLLRTIFPSI